MERFAIKVDKKLKANLFKICRLCGIDNPNKVTILDEVVSLIFDAEDELPLYKKIFNCIGIQVTPDDKMPKTICTLCYDKINDFHEFREMCYSTNSQTRKLLGLAILPSNGELKWDVNTFINPVVPEIQLTKGRCRKRKPNDIPMVLPIDNKLIKLESSHSIDISNSLRKRIPAVDLIKNEKEMSIEKKSKKGPVLYNCTICKVNFCSDALLQSHLLKIHVPIVARYHCVQCNETIAHSLEIKNHNLWHKLSKTPYKCGRCDRKLNSVHGLTRHVRECSNKQIRKTPISPDIKCKFCLVEYQTKTLFYMHNCVSCKLICPKCNCKLSSKLTTLRHIASCSAEADLIEEDFVIKNEPIDLPKTLSNIPSTSLSNNNNLSMVVIPALSVNLTAVQQPTEIPKKSKKSKKNTEDALRRCDELLKTTMKTLVSIKHEPVDDNIANNTSLDKPGTVHDNAKSKASMDQTKDVPQENDATDNSGIKIKQEVINEDYRDFDTNIEINIKQEMPIDTNGDKSQPTLKLKIKKEHGKLNSSFIQNNESGSGISIPLNTTEHQKRKSKRLNVCSPKQDSSTNNDLQQSSEREKVIGAPPAKKIVFPSPIKIKTEILDETDAYDNSEIMENDHHNDNYESDDSDANTKVQNAPQTNTDLPIISNVESFAVLNRDTSEMNDTNCFDSNLGVVESNQTEKEIMTMPLMKISSVSSGVLFNKVFSPSKTEKTNEESQTAAIPKDSLIPQILSVSGGVEFPRPDINKKDKPQHSKKYSHTPQMTKSPSATENTNNLSLLIQIKEEILDPGYENYNNECNDKICEEMISSSTNDILEDTNFIGAVKIKQEIDIAEECFGDEVDSDSDDNSESDEYTNNLNDNTEIDSTETENIFMNHIDERSDLSKTDPKQQSDSILTMSENIERNSETQINIDVISSNQGKDMSTTDLKCNIVNESTDICGKVSSITLEILSTEFVNDSDNTRNYKQVNDDDLTERTTTPLANIENELSADIEEEVHLSQSEITERTEESDVQPIRIIPTESSASSVNVTSPTSAELSVNLLSETCSTSANPEIKNLNEIAENHNNENLEKLLRDDNSVDMNSVENIPEIGDGQIEERSSPEDTEIKENNENILTNDIETATNCADIDEESSEKDCPRATTSCD